MNVILCEDVDNLGEMGHKVKVAAGYARNFLIPRKLAVPMDSASAKQIEHELKIIHRREEKRRVEMSKLAKQIDGIVVEFVMRAGEGDKLYGSVTTQQIAEKLAELGHVINRRHLVLAEPVKTLGTHAAQLKMPGGVTAKVNVRVNRLIEEQPVVVEEEVEEHDDEAYSDDDED